MNTSALGMDSAASGIKKRTCRDKASCNALGGRESRNEEVGKGSWPTWAKKGADNDTQNGSQTRSKMVSGAQEPPRGCQGAMLHQLDPLDILHEFYHACQPLDFRPELSKSRLKSSGWPAWLFWSKTQSQSRNNKTHSTLPSASAHCGLLQTAAA